VEAWPGPGYARAVIFWEPGATDADTVRAALTEPSYDELQDRWREPGFTIEGYDPLALD
jgi:hypothetical protein